MASLNGTTITPSDIEAELIIIGDMVEGYDGTSTLMKDASGDGEKWRWIITWNDVPAATRNAIRNIAKLNTTFTFVDEDGTSYTVLPELQPYSARVSSIAGNGTLYYTVTLKIRQE